MPGWGAEPCRCRPHPQDPPEPWPQPDAELRLLQAELASARARRRAWLLRALDAATTLKTRLEAELGAPDDVPEPPTRAVCGERERLRTRLTAAHAQGRLDEAARAATAAGLPLDAGGVRRALCGAPGSGPAPRGEWGPDAADAALVLHNHCATLVHARRGGPSGASSPASPLPRLASARPLVFLDVSVDGRTAGRLVLELRADVAPRMTRNFMSLCCVESGGYRGSSVFQCWPGESVLAGDGPPGAEAHFAPDESGLSAVRGAVGMRRAQRRRDARGLVAAQFRIVLREMRGFSAVFGAVREGLPLVDRLSRAGDSSGRPQANILIADCGLLE